MPVEIAAIGVQRPFVLEALEKEFVLHRVWDAADKVKALEPYADRIRGAVSHGMAGLPTAIIEALPNLEICAINGVGLETTDLELARARGITVTTAPVLFDDVADLAILLGMAAARRLAEADRFVRSGAWATGRFPQGRKFTGMKAGILGLGRIGTEVWNRLKGFQMEIGYYDPMPKADMPLRRYASPVELAAASDILFMCAAGGAGVRNIVDAAVIDALGPRGIFVNVARGWLVDEPALIAALAEGRLGAAGLDVFADEPNVPEQLRALDNVVLAPHIASNTEETMREMGECVLENIRSWFAGKGALTAVA
jgi:lactate dehydrogenase-like 2-hydroxyacid dehydrogenase